jgi:hypothetical protein
LNLLDAQCTQSAKFFMAGHLCLASGVLLFVETSENIKGKGYEYPVAHR